MSPPSTPDVNVIAGAVASVISATRAKRADEIERENAVGHGIDMVIRQFIEVFKVDPAFDERVFQDNCESKSADVRLY